MRRPNRAAVAASAAVVAGSVLSGAADPDTARLTPHGAGIMLADQATPAGAIGDSIGIAAGMPPSTLDPFETGVKALLDMIGIGEKTPVQLFINSSLTIGELLNGSSTPTVSVNTELHIADTLNLLGLDNISLGQVMTALSLSPSLTVDEALSNMQFLNAKLDNILMPLGFSSTMTLLNLEEKFSVNNLTVDQLLPILGFQGNETLGQVTGFYGIAGLINGYLGAIGLVCPGGWSTGTTIDTAIGCIRWTGPDGTSHTLNGSDKLGWVLQNDQMPDGRTLAQYTLGEALNFNSNTTIRQVIDNLHVNLSGIWVGPGAPNGVPSVPDLNSLPPLGGQSLGAVMNWAGMSPTQSLGDFISNLQVGGQPLGTMTLGDALDGLILDHSALSTPGVEDSTPVADFLNSMGWGMYTVDELLNLAS